MVVSGFVVVVVVVAGVVVVVDGGTVVVVVVGGGLVVVVVRGGTVVVVLGGGVRTGGLVVVVVVALAADVVGFGAGFNTRADAGTGPAPTKAAVGMFRLASNGAGNPKATGAVLPRLLRVAKEETAHGGSVSGEAVVDGAAGVKTVEGDVFVAIDRSGAPFDGSVSF